MDKKLTTFTVDPRYVKTPDTRIRTYDVKVNLGSKSSDHLVVKRVRDRTGQVEVKRGDTINRSLGKAVKEDISLYLSPLKAVASEFSKQLRKSK